MRSNRTQVNFMLHSGATAMQYHKLFVQDMYINVLQTKVRNQWV
jgi:hypothetical protein